MNGLPEPTPPRACGDIDTHVTALGYVTSSRATRLGDAELQEQAVTLRRYCGTRGWRLAGLVHDADAGTGSDLGPAIAQGIERIANGDTSCLLVIDLGCVCRSVARLGGILDALDRVGGRLVSLRPSIDTGTDSGREAARVLLAVTRWEQSWRADRSRRGLAAARAKGTIKPAIDDDLKRRIERMRSGGMTLQAIADELNDAGVPTVRGGSTWRKSSVQSAVGYRRPARMPRPAWETGA